LIPGLCGRVLGFATVPLPIAPRHLLIVVAAAAATILPWRGRRSRRNGPDFMLELVRRHVKLLAGDKTVHTGFIGYHVVVLLARLLPRVRLCRPGDARASAATRAARLPPLEC